MRFFFIIESLKMVPSKHMTRQNEGQSVLFPAMPHLCGWWQLKGSQTEAKVDRGTVLRGLSDRGAMAVERMTASYVSPGGSRPFLLALPLSLELAWPVRHQNDGQNKLFPHIPI